MTVSDAIFERTFNNVDAHPREFVRFHDETRQVDE